MNVGLSAVGAPVGLAAAHRSARRGESCQAQPHLPRGFCRIINGILLAAAGLYSKHHGVGGRANQAARARSPRTVEPEGAGEGEGDTSDEGEGDTSVTPALEGEGEGEAAPPPPPAWAWGREAKGEPTRNVGR